MSIWRQGILTDPAHQVWQVPPRAGASSHSDALDAYAKRRDRILPKLSTPAFFVSERGTRITEWSARYTFAKISRQIGLRAPRGPAPRTRSAAA